jgi:ATP adenylyltransferase
MKMNNPYLTAIKRNKPSAPVKWLFYNMYLRGSILDFGCGRGDDVGYLNAEGYDPYWAPDTDLLNRKYDIVLCTYVLNVLPATKRKVILREIKNLLNDTGLAYVTVRRDLKHSIVETSRSRQYYVQIKAPIIRQTSQYCIYQITKEKQ